ncbi:helix-turn-helix domain-containing protein [Streptomyces sp. NPDC088785]|uniref:helix-turn-helix domain-containing protein n=1 Tax=Streptomyces sp. NPDC088785 TaxID=3365897 RepID=UPI003804ED23
MPRRATPLSPDDGPQARFAIALRQLRDSAGFDAMTIQAIAARNDMPPSTLHAALRGQRIPSVPVLAALVRAWDGDEAEWMQKRTQVEDEVERSRLRTRGELSLEAPDGATVARTVESDRMQLRVSEDDEVLHAIREARRSLDRDPDNERLKEWLDVLLSRPVTGEPVEEPPAPSNSNSSREVSDALKSAIGAASTDEIVRELESRQVYSLGEARGAEERLLWRELRLRAGAPAIRAISLQAGVAQAEVGAVLRGEPALGAAEVIAALDEMAAEIAAEAAN